MSSLFLSLESLFDLDDLSALSVRDPQTCVADFPCLLAEDRPEKLFFRRLVGLAFRCDLSDKYVSSLYFCAYPDYSVLVEVLQGIFANVGDVLVISSGPSFVSRDSTSYSSICIEV